MDMNDDTSSWSNLHPQNVDILGIVTSKYPTHIDVISVLRITGLSGYLKVKGQAKNACTYSC